MRQAALNSPYQPKVEGSSPAAAGGTMRVKITKNVQNDIAYH